MLNAKKICYYLFGKPYSFLKLNVAYCIFCRFLKASGCVIRTINLFAGSFTGSFTGPFYRGVYSGVYSGVIGGVFYRHLHLHFYLHSTINKPINAYADTTNPYFIVFRLVFVAQVSGNSNHREK